MKILMLTPYLPYPLLSGGQIRTYNLLKHLNKEHKITLFALIKDESEKRYIPELEKVCHQVKVFKRPKKPFTLKNIVRTGFSKYPFLVIRNYSKKAANAIKAEIAKNRYDLIHAETFYMMPHLPQTKMPVILVEQTIEYLGYESYVKKAPKLLQPLLNIDVNKIKNWEKHYWKKAHKLIVMSQEDKDFVIKKIEQPEKVAVVENGVDVYWFDQKLKHLPKEPTVLFVGTFNWLPNREAVKFLVKKFWPKLKPRLKDVRLWIVGNSPTPDVLKLEQEDSRIKVTGGIPDIRDAFKSAHVLIAPVFSGKGTRYKVLEAMAAGTPIVATKLAVEGLRVKDKEHVLIAEKVEEMIQATTQILTEQKLAKRLATNAKRYVKTHYDWPLIAKKLNQIYNSFS